MIYPVSRGCLSTSSSSIPFRRLANFIEARGCVLLLRWFVRHARSAGAAAQSRGRGVRGANVCWLNMQGVHTACFECHLCAQKRQWLSARYYECGDNLLRTTFSIVAIITV